MKRALVLLVLLSMLSPITTAQQVGLAGGGDQLTAGEINLDRPLGISSSSMPDWPSPEKPIPHHEPGQPARAGNYTTEVVRENLLGVEEVVEISGLDAMTADGVDPLAGNYTLVNLDKILLSRYRDDQTSLQTFTSTLELIPGSQRDLGNYMTNHIAAGDLNADGQAEQIAAWIDWAESHVYMSIGEMPGSLGRTTSAPAAVVYVDGSIDLFVRGYDAALWHRHSDDGLTWGAWNNAANGKLLSAPAVASQAAGQFDVFVVGTGNQVYRAHWEGGWSGGWQAAGDWPYPEPAWIGSTPNLPAPAAVARGGGFDLFRLGPDNTLRWLHSEDGADWGDWQDLGGMLASGPGVVSLSPDHMQVFARGMDEALWHRTYNSSWGPWQRVELYGMDEGVTIASPPTVISVGSGQIQAYVRGSDNQLWQLTFDGSSWSNWSSPGGMLASGVAVTAGDWKFIAQAADGSLQHSANGADWIAWGGLPPCCVTYDTELVGQGIGLSPYKDFSLDVETGYFLGDGRSQIVLTYFSSDQRVTLVLYKLGEGFNPQMVDVLELAHDVDYVSITTGDFLDQDGIDEVALAYVHGQSYGVDIIRLTSDGSEVVIEGAPETDGTRCWNNSNPMKFAGTLEVASGDFDADGQDEIALTVIFDCEDYDTYTTCHTYRYHARNRIFDVVNPYELGVYNIEEQWTDEVRRSTGEWTVGLTIAAGDVDGDGQDELIRTWPVRFDGDTWFGCGLWEWYPRNDRFERKVQVYKLPAGAWPAGGGQIESTLFYENNDGLSVTDNAFIDRLALGDLDRDLRREIVWLIGVSGDEKLRTYDYEPESADPPFVQNETTLPALYYPHLATGDFTGEGIRVGRPSYRVQNRVDTMMAQLNMPPKHRDLIKVAGGEYQLIESPQGACTPSPDSPNCTHAKYAALDFTSSEQTVTTQHAYEISAGLENETCAGAGIGGIAEVKACTRRSINATHGGNFEKSTEEIQSIAYRRKVIAANDDKLVYSGTPYGVWEYPVLSGGGTELSDEVFITVAFPLISITPYPDTSGGYLSGTCDETWYAASHQPNNVWSYDPIGDVTFEDYDSRYELVYDALEGDWAEGEITFEDISKDFESISFMHAISARVETEVSAEAKIKVVNLSGSFKAHVQGDYNHTALETDTVTNKEETSFSYFFAPQPDGAKFITRVLFYKAKDDSMVMNYQAEPGQAASWQLYDKPDPAFILPWYGFPDPSDPQVPPCGEDQKLFSPSIVINPPYAILGETVTISATVRNFSNYLTEDVLVRFYQGDPQNDIVIGQETIPSLSRESGPETVSISWPAQGVGQQKIYAVIDPNDSIAEIHDEDDLINNNMAYGIFQLAATGIADMGLTPRQPPYDVVTYALEDAQALVSLYVPRASLNAVARFVVASTEVIQPADGLVFEVVAYQGSKYKMWNDPVDNFNFKPGDEDPPAVISIIYGQAGFGAMDENELMLYRLDGAEWEDATCAGYDTVRFPAEERLVVPICETGIFLLSDGHNLPHSTSLYLPVIWSKTNY